MVGKANAATKIIEKVGTLIKQRATHPKLENYKFYLCQKNLTHGQKRWRQRQVGWNVTETSLVGRAPLPLSRWFETVELCTVEAPKA
jgi:hypothetical protein